MIRWGKRAGRRSLQAVGVAAAVLLALAMLVNFGGILLQGGLGLPMLLIVGAIGVGGPALVWWVFSRRR